MEDDIKRMITNSEAHRCGWLKLYDVIRIDHKGKKIHPLFDANWRRYLYILPLKSKLSSVKIIPLEDSTDSVSSSGLRVDTDHTSDTNIVSYTVDVSFINKALSRYLNICR